MSSKKLILIADLQDGIDLAVEALSTDFDLITTVSLKEAEAHLIASEAGRSFDWIVVGTHFDDSQMITLLEYIRSVDHLDELVFLPIQTKSSITNLANNSLDKMLELLGSRPVLVLNENSTQESCDLLKNAVLESFAHTVNKGRIDEAPRNEFGSAKEQNLRA